MGRITDEFVERAIQTPDKAAVVVGDRLYSYGRFLKEVQQVAGYVAQLGSESTGLARDGLPRVALLSANRIEFMSVFLGTAKAGGVTMVLSPSWGVAQLQEVLQRWPPDWLVGEAALLKLDLSPDLSMPTTALPALPPVNLSWSHVLTQNAEAIAPDPELPFYICFTSGTTGRPKGIVKSHRSWLAGLTASRAEFGIDAADQVFVPGGLSHSLSLYAATEALSAGATLHLLSQVTGAAAVSWMRQHPITVVVAVPTLLHLVVKAMAQALTFPAVRLVISGGAKLTEHMTQALARVYPQARIIEYYGASELGFVSVRSGRSVPPESVGRPFTGVELSIQRLEGSGEAAVGECGWVSLRSSMICSGYLEGGAAAGLRQLNGWWTVGDRGWQDEQGYLYLAGREEMLVCAGVNVYPAEVEAALLNLPEVAAAAVLGVSDDCRGDVIYAVVAWEGEALSRRSLRLRLRPYLNRYALPRRVYALPKLPLTPSGKVARALLTEQLGRGELTPYEVR